MGLFNVISVFLIIVYSSFNGLNFISTKTSRNLLDTSGINDFSLKKQNNRGIFNKYSLIDELVL